MANEEDKITKRLVDKQVQVLKEQEKAADSQVRTNEFIIKEWKKTSEATVSIREDVKSTIARQIEASEAYKQAAVKPDPAARQNTFALGEFLKSSKVAQSVQMQASTAMNSLSSHMNEVLGPLQEVADFTKRTFANIGGFFKGIGQDLGLFLGEGDVDEKQLDEQKKTTSWLRRMFFFMDSERKAKFAESMKTKTKKGGGGVLAFILGAIGIAIGAFVRTIVFPFELLLKIPGIRKLRTFIKPLRKMFIRLLWIFRRSKILGPLLRGIRRGFTRFFWPLQILLSLIDFIRGFAATEGDILDKIKGGLMTAFIKLMELPIRAFGWFLEKMGFEGATANILAVVKTIFGGILDFILSPFKLIQKAFVLI